MFQIKYKAKAINRDSGLMFRSNYKNGDWVYGLLTKKDTIFNTAEMTDINGVSGIEVDPNTICVFTNKLDSDKKEIYTGDILLFRDEEVAGKVFFDKDSAGFAITLENDYYDGECFEDGEIIGNIYDNPELLENL